MAGSDAYIVYPPVNLEKFSFNIENNDEKENLVVTIGRFDRGKILHIIPLEQVRYLTLNT